MVGKVVSDEDPEVKFWAETLQGEVEKDRGWCDQQLSFPTNFSVLASSLISLFLITLCCFQWSVWLCHLRFLYMAFVLKLDP